MHCLKNRDMHEKKPRQFNRYNIHTVAKVRVQGAIDWIEVKVLTLSPMGACFQSIETFSTTQILEFYMPSPNSSNPPYHLAAKIIWAKDGQVGVEFTGSLRAG